jgi:hypothetical protein
MCKIRVCSEEQHTTYIHTINSTSTYTYIHITHDTEQVCIYGDIHTATLVEDEPHQHFSHIYLSHILDSPANVWLSRFMALQPCLQERFCKVADRYIDVYVPTPTHSMQAIMPCMHPCCSVLQYNDLVIMINLNLNYLVK